jgi:cell division protein FtsL
MASTPTRRIDLSRLRSVVPAARERIERLRSGELSFAAVALIVVFGSLLGIVVLQTFIVQNRVQLDVVNRELAEAQEENQRLRLEVIELEAPDRILDSAVERIGMIRPDERRYLPGIDPEVAEVRLPASADPFAAAPLPEWLLEPEPEPEPEPVAEPEPAADDATETSESTDPPDSETDEGGDG